MKCPIILITNLLRSLASPFESVPVVDVALADVTPLAVLSTVRFVITPSGVLAEMFSVFFSTVESVCFQYGALKHTTHNGIQSK